MYKPLQKKNSSWTPTTAKKKSKSPSKLGHFSTQPKPNKKSSQPPEIGEYSRDSADRLAANVMRSLEAKDAQETETPTVQPQSESRISVADVVGQRMPTVMARTLTPQVRQNNYTNSQIQRQCGVDQSCIEEPNASYPEQNYTPANLEPNASYPEPNASPEGEADQQSNASSAVQNGMAGGIFQELRYPVPQNLPGPNPGTAARYNLSFRDFSGHPNPTSHAYLNRTSPPANSWKGLRLDYGPNVKTGGSTNWHWNQSGAGKTFGIADHTVASPRAANFGRAMKYAKPLGRGALAVGAGMDAYSLGTEINQSVQTGDWDNTVVEGSRIAGGWAGAYGGAKALGAAGAGIGTLIAPGIGTAVGGAIGGLAGGALGYFGGSALGSWLGGQATD